MAEFILETQGSVEKHSSLPVWPGDNGHPAPGQVINWITWRDLDSFAQGYIEALFFTENEPSTTRAERSSKPEEWAERVEEGQQKDIPGDYGFADLAPESLAKIIADCRTFQAGAAYQALEAADWDTPIKGGKWGELHDTLAGRDFWYTRNGHGCGFWDGDWPEPHASALTDAAKSFRQVDAYLGDDGRVYLS